MNVERLIDLLPRHGLQFQFPVTGPPGESVWTPPSSETPAQLARLEAELGGTLPISLAAWSTVVGSVCLMRVDDTGPDVAYPDPLVVLPPEAVLEELAEWRQDRLLRDMKPRFAAPMAPDDHHKEDVSGGPSYEIELPDPYADARVRNLEPSMMFVRYLRHAFEWAGLPGCAKVYGEPHPMIATIAAELLPL
jgi:hypothetical protein